MYYDELNPTPDETSGGTYSTGRSEQEPDQNSAVIVLCLLLVVFIILAGIFSGPAAKENRSMQEKELSDSDPSAQNSETAPIPDSPDYIVHYTYDDKDYFGFLFRPITGELPDGYILTSSEIFSDPAPTSIRISFGDGHHYTAYFRDKNDALGVALLVIHGIDLPEGATLSKLDSSLNSALLYLDGAPNAALSFQYETLSDKNVFINKTFLKLNVLPELAKPGSPIYNDAGQVIAIMANPEKRSGGLDPEADYAAAIENVDDWVWDTLQNPMRYIGIHGKIISSPKKESLSLNGGFCVNYVEATKTYDLTTCLSPGDLILGFFDNYSLTRPNNLTGPDELNKLYNNFTDGKLVALSVFRPKNKDRTTTIFLRHNIER